MTRLLASVRDEQEAELAIACGADYLVVDDPEKGMFSGVSLDKVQTLVGTVARRLPIGAAAGEIAMPLNQGVRALEPLVASGIDFLKIGLDAKSPIKTCIRALAPLAKTTRLIGVLFADQKPDFSSLALMAKSGFHGAMLDTATKNGMRLLDHMGISALAHFVKDCKKHGLMCGLAGSLEAPDVPRLLNLNPDWLGFRGALTSAHDRKQGLERRAFSSIRDLIPAPAESLLRSDLAHVRASAKVSDQAILTDRIFVHDLILSACIGAYGAERDMPQDVRFNVDVDVARISNASDKMRDIFSYDLIIDAIRIILGRGHVAMVETLAEDIAKNVLQHPRVMRAIVRVEKLDVVAGSVGIEIVRDRDAASV